MLLLGLYVVRWKEKCLDWWTCMLLCALQVSDSLLHDPNSSPEALYYAAQTILTKVIDYSYFRCWTLTWADSRGFVNLRHELWCCVDRSHDIGQVAILRKSEPKQAAQLRRFLQLIDKVIPSLCTLVGAGATWFWRIATFCSSLTSQLSIGKSYVNR